MCPPSRLSPNYQHLTNTTPLCLFLINPDATGTLTCITGEPTHKEFCILEKELAANLMAIPCP
jgi:hypothetical protein